MNPTSSQSITKEMGETERTVSAVAGSLLLYYVTRKHKVDALLLLGGGYLLYRAISGHCPVSSAFHRKGVPGHASNINIKTHVIVARPREEVYAFWRRLENLPLFMRHLDHIDEIDDTTAAWKISLPGRVGEVRWETKIVKDEKNSEISWHSVPGAPIENTAKINFSDTPGKATRVDIMLSYRAPGGVIGEQLATLLTPVFRDKVEDDIRRFKYFMENQGKTAGEQVPG